MRVGQPSNPVQSSDTSGTKKTDKAGAAKAAEKAATARGPQSATTILGSTNAEISTKGRELAKAKTVATSTPDVREEKIAELKRRIAEGSYKVDTKAVADKMVDDHLETARSGALG